MRVMRVSHYATGAAPSTDIYSYFFRYLQEERIVARPEAFFVEHVLGSFLVLLVGVAAAAAALAWETSQKGGGGPDFNKGKKPYLGRGIYFY